MRKVLSLRAWWLQLLSRLGGGGTGTASPTVDELLSLCMASTCPFSSEGGGGMATSLPRSIVEPFRNARAEVERALESAARLPEEISRAVAYWKHFIALIEHGIEQRRQRVELLVGEARPWLPMLLACAGQPGEAGLGPAEASSLAARGIEVAELLGQVHLLGRSLRLGQAQASVGEATQRRVADAAGAGRGDGGGRDPEPAESEEEEEMSCSGSDSEGE